MSNRDFAPHPQIAKDTLEIGDLPLSRLFLMNDTTYHWLLLVPRYADAREIIDLEPADRVQLMAEICLASDVLRAHTQCDKLNVASLGNAVAQLHVHIIARFKTDPAWPKPVWGAAPAVPYSHETSSKLISQLRKSLSIA